MNKTVTFLYSSVGRKMLMGLSGLFLCSFLVVHLYINLFLFKQDAGSTFDAYAEFMATYPLLRPLEIVLFAGFLLHAVVGIWLWIGNRRARPERYDVNRGSENSTLSSRLSFVTGSIVFVFLVIHVNTFFVQSRFFETSMTMYDLVAEAFRNPVYDVFYLVAIFFLAYHLKHGFQSAFQTLGLLHSRYKKLIEAVGFIFWFLIPLAFAAIPVYFYFSQAHGGY